jgi:hypothetical protein
MGTTPNYQWPYPESTDVPDGAAQIRALGQAVDATMLALDTRVGRIGALLGYSTQISSPPFTTVGTPVDFTAGQWPSVTLTVPPSKKIQIIMSASMSNTNTATSTIWCQFRMSPASGTPIRAMSCQGTRLYASRSCVVTGLTAGAITIFPQWNISSGNAATATFIEGELQVWALDS